MSRTVSRRHILTGELVAVTAVSVGGGDRAADADIIIQRDGADRPVLPGTSLAGVLRAALRARQDPLADRIRLWGEASETTGRAGSVTVEDAPAVGDATSAAPTPVRHTTSIDRVDAAAADRRLFSREVVPAGTRFAVRLHVDDDRLGPGGDVDRLLKALQNLLVTEGIHVGGAGTRGLGLLQLTRATTVVHDLGTRAGMIERLRGGRGAPVWAHPVIQQPAAGQTPTHPAPKPLYTLAPSPNTIRVRIPWRPIGAVQTHVMVEGEAADRIPLTETDLTGATTPTGSQPVDVRLLLAGSSIKGALRSHSERILRTVVTGIPPHLGEFDRQLDLPGPIREVFGAVGDGRSGTQTGRRGALTAYDCTSAITLPGRAWAEFSAQLDPDTLALLAPPTPTHVATAMPATPVVSAATPAQQPRPLPGPPKPGPPKPGPPPGAVAAQLPASSTLAMQDEAPQQDDPGQQKQRRTGDLAKTLEALSAAAPGLRLRLAQHVAVDRWTGGAADARLFAEIDAEQTDDEPPLWRPLVVDLDLSRLPAPSRPAAVTLLALVLRDLSDGWLPLGAGVTRGLGAVRVSADDVTFTTGAQLGDPWNRLSERTLTDLLEGRGAALTRLRDDLTTAWQSAVAEATVAVAARVQLEHEEAAR